MMTARPEATPSPLDIPGHFATLPDPRHPAFRDFHLFGDIVAIALCAVLSGATSWEAIASFGRRKQQWLMSLGLSLPNGIPCHDTFNRIFAAISPGAFQGCFNGWLCSACDALGVAHIPIDGKALRGSRGPDGTCLHLVSAWAAEGRLSLAQVAVAGKSNEITAIPLLLQVLDLEGALVSIDAIGCQKEIASAVLAANGDYLLAVKENQPTLRADIAAAFEGAEEAGFAGVRHDSYATKEDGHGRQEERRYTVLYDLGGLSTRDDWEGLTSVVRVERRRRQGDKGSTEVAYYISSSGAAAQVLARGIRLHWGIENGCHWVLDVIFGEDRCRARQGHAAENLAWLRKVALSLLGQERGKASYRTMQFELAIDDDYRLQLLRKLLSQ
jgi:predicted transposase YbfD/YdcC